MADRAVSRFERMMSLYDVHVENFLKTVGPFNALDLLRITLEGKSILKFNISSLDGIAITQNSSDHMFFQPSYALFKGH